MSRAVDAVKAQASDHDGGRQRWIEVAKGLGILVVVAYHVVGSYRAEGAPASLLELNTNWDVRLRNSMPVFFFISGLLALRTLRKPGRAFWAYLGRRLLYPYVVWSVLSVALNTYVAGRGANRRFEPHDLLLIAWRPVLQYWYLLALVCYLLVGRLVLRVDGSRRSLVVLAAVAWLALVLGVGVDGYFSRMLELHFGFFALGLLGGPAVVAFVERRGNRALVAAAIVGGAAMALVVRPGSAWPAWQVLPAFAGLLPLATLVSVSVVVARRRAGSALEHLGARSLEIYVAHVIAAAAVRIALFHVGVRSLPVHLTAGVLAGTLGPLALDAAVRACWLPNPFRLAAGRPPLGRGPTRARAA